jgi:antitoxin VapB
MGLSINNPELPTLAAELAQLRNVSVDEAVTDAVREELARRKQPREKASVEELLAMAKEIAAHMDPDFRSEDVDALLYDERGLPK